MPLGALAAEDAENKRFLRLLVRFYRKQKSFCNADSKITAIQNATTNRRRHVVSVLLKTNAVSMNYNILTFISQMLSNLNKPLLDFKPTQIRSLARLLVIIIHILYDKTSLHYDIC